MDISVDGLLRLYPRTVRGRAWILLPRVAALCLSWDHFRRDHTLASGSGEAGGSYNIPHTFLSWGICLCCLLGVACAVSLNERFVI
jgi:hypothetical protein